MRPRRAAGAMISVFGFDLGSFLLVPLHRGFEGLADEDWQHFGANQQLDASSDTWLARDEALAFEGEHHLMDGGRAHPEVALHVCFGGWTTEHLGISVNEGQVLTLLAGET
jgi:hypothetical protein